MFHALSYLYDLQRFGIKAGLRNISRIAGELGNPERSYPIIHIAGTNGKGSTAAMIASVLTAAGYRTGLYTSPHLVRFNERIRVDGHEIEDEDVGRYAKILKPLIDKTRGTFFEATTAMAFQYFADTNVDIAVLETGLGGRWDATNVVRPILSIITTISYDHTEYLGKSLSRIAREKGGILKAGVPALTGVDDEGVCRLLGEIARKKKVPFRIAGKISSVGIRTTTIESLTLDLETPRQMYRDICVSLGGSHQAQNLRLAVLGIEELAKSFGKIPEAKIRRGLASIRKNTGFRGRLEVLSRRPLCIGDVAHNPEALRTVVGELNSIMGMKIPVVFGVMKDKDVRSMVPELKKLARLVIAVEPDTPRALGSRRLTDEIHRLAIPAIDGKSVANGIRTALGERREGEPVLLVGSHFVVGEGIPLFADSTRNAVIL